MLLGNNFTNMFKGLKEPKAEDSGGLLPLTLGRRI